MADVELGRLLGAAPGVHYPHVGGEDGTIMAAAANPRNDYGNSRVDGLDGRMKEWLYGEYDGGGVLSVAMYGMNLIASAGREGGVKLFRFVEYNGSRSTNNAKEGEGNNEEGGLKYVASVPTLLRPLPGAIPILVTCLKFDSMGRLYIGGNDGFLRMVTFPEEYFGGVVDSGGGATSGRKQGRKEMQVTVLNASTGTTPSPILSLDISEDVTSLDDVWIVTSHAHGNVCVHSIKSDYYGDEEVEESKGGGGGGAVSSTFCGMWNPFSSSSSTSDQGKTPSYARSVAFVSRDITQGGSSINDDDTIDDTIDKPFTSKGVVVGGGNGELWVCDIDPSYTATSGGAGGNSASKETTTTISSPSNTAKNQLFRLDTSRRIGPWHIGPVIAVATRPGGIVISTGHDGMLRVSEVWPPSNNKGNDTSSSDSEATDISSSGPKEVLYGLQGYKVWIGNICIDSEGKRLLSDGRDDIVVVHDFSKDPSEENDDIGDEE